MADDRTLALRRAAAERSRRRYRRQPGDLRRSRTECPYCGRHYYAALAPCDCPGARRATTDLGGAA